MATNTATKMTVKSPVIQNAQFARQLRFFALTASLTLFALLLLSIYLLPFANMITTSLRSPDSLSQTRDSSVLPMLPVTFTYEGEELEVFEVELNGEMRDLAMLKPGRQASQFIDTANPDAGIIEWEGNWRLLVQKQEFAPEWNNYQEAWERINFPRLFFNTLVIAISGVIGTLLSCICVAYAFARFPIPGKNFLFVILIGTIILPSQVTLIPTYIFFSTIGWVGSWLPLIVPHFFSNAYNVFLLRQYFMTLPRELDEAAMIDGAGPFRILINIIIPQSWPAIIAVAIFHFVFAWNDFFGPLIYLLSKPNLQPIAVGVQIFNFQYGPRPELVQATSLMAMVLPIVIFFLAQRFFMRGVVITGVDK
jgi:multiple sugar transport system permease protein